ncbi:MAG TPA: 2-isopropylmalate synthase [Planctomycetota bacterium]|nr:2-isopropylmalate synthase [Planctomycetota bacterium]HRR82072.1 2-isopropylmalate synthase [Planctomycetota bacterium]
MAHRRELVEVTQPRLLEEMFPYDLPPRIVFDSKVCEEIDGELVEFAPKALLTRDIRITDTTFRDGQQSLPPYTVEQTRRLFEFLVRLSGPNGVIRQTEFFLYTDKDRAAVEACREVGARFPEITGWIRADVGDLVNVERLGLRETGILTSCSDYHIFYKLRKDRRQILDHYLGVVKAALDAGIRPRCHLEDVTRADIDGFVVPFCTKLAELSESLPEHLKVKVRLCDTMGFGLSYPGVALPRSVPKLVYRMTHDAGIPSDRLEWHGHNDFHKVHINAVTAWLYGVDAVNATLFGIGERTGNPPLEGAIFEYVAIKGTLNGVDTYAITDLVNYYEHEIGHTLPDNAPFVGKHFATTRAGIHADGLWRDERIYNIFDTMALLGRPPAVAITDKSGADGVALWVNNFLDLHGKDRLSKIKLHKICRWVADQYAAGRTSTVSDQEMIAQIRLHLPEQYEAFMQRRRQKQ